MEPEFVIPFIDSVCGLFSQLFQISVQRGDLVVSHYEGANDFVALVGLSSPARATVSLSFPAATARAIVARLIDGQAAGLDEELAADGLGELVNIVAGSAKERLAHPEQEPIELGLPVVIRGRQQIMKNTENGPWLTVTFTGETGPFTLGVMFNEVHGTRIEAINPFINSVHEFARTMLGTEFTAGSIMVSERCGRPEDLVAFIGLGGPVRGTVVLSFPTESALGIVGKLLGATYDDIDDDVIDGLAEVLNIVAGMAKKDLVGENDIPFVLTLPSVMSGNAQRIDHPRSIWAEIAFNSSLGSFSLQVNFEPNEGESQ
jgi:chemotaxis protein CheX